uniref:Uncharacterized protein n=1 Tax=Glossina austeni TaxID=7395 RepID=A0A1A9UCL1_GLOAU
MQNKTGSLLKRIKHDRVIAEITYHSLDGNENNVDDETRDNGVNTELSYEADSTDTVTLRRRIIPRIESDVAGSEKSCGHLGGPYPCVSLKNLKTSFSPILSTPGFIKYYTSCFTDHIRRVNSSESVITVSKTVKYVGRLIVVEKCGQVHFPRRQAVVSACVEKCGYVLQRKEFEVHFRVPDCVKLQTALTIVLFCVLYPLPLPPPQLVIDHIDEMID